MQTKIEDIHAILSFIAEYDLHDDVCWRCDGSRAPITFWFNCNDFMA